VYVTRFSQCISVTSCAGTISLGGCHTTLCLPCETSHAALSEEDRRALGLGADCFRFQHHFVVPNLKTLGM
jgi:cystathionine beta-lyase/cystathionine gamma-synthase